MVSRVSRRICKCYESKQKAKNLQPDVQFTCSQNFVHLKLCAQDHSVGEAGRNSPSLSKFGEKPPELAKFAVHWRPRPSQH